LSDHEDTNLLEHDQMEEDMEMDTQPKENKTEKPPPIILHGKFASQNCSIFARHRKGGVFKIQFKV
jgi:hypothetical protein